MSDSNSRRHFLKNMSAGAAVTFLSPYERLADSIVRAFIQSAYAQETVGITSRYYVSFFFNGGPHRVLFDQWLRTNADDPAIIPNASMTTAYKISGGKVTGYDYKTFTADNGLLVPHLFSQTIRTTSGQKALSLILKNMLAVRGFSSGIDGHSLNASLQQLPLAGAPSIMALPAEYSKSPYAAVRYNAGGPFVSLSGKAVSELVGSNPLKSLFESLQPSATSLQKIKSIKERNVATYERAEAQLKVLSQSDAIGAKALKANMDNARAILKKGIGDIDGYWQQSVPRYEAVINEAARGTGIPGISDISFSPSGDATWRVSDTDMANPSQDFRDAVKTATGSAIAEAFALSEYLIAGNYAPSMQFGLNGLENMNILGGDTRFPIQGVGADAHGIGQSVQIMYLNAFYRALLAGVMEFKERLEQISLGSGQTAWNQTVIHFSGDFPRLGRSDGSGSDHGWDQNANSIISGAFNNGPVCVGNVRQGTAGGVYGGTVGSATAIAGYPVAGTPGISFPGSHVANILGLPINPYGNVAPPAARLVGSNLVVSYPGKVISGG